MHPCCLHSLYEFQVTNYYAAFQSSTKTTNELKMHLVTNCET